MVTLHSVRTVECESELGTLQGEAGPDRLSDCMQAVGSRLKPTPQPWAAVHAQGCTLLLIGTCSS